MTESKDKHTGNTASRIGGVELLVLTVMSGLALGTVYGLFDYLHHAPNLAPADFLITVALASGPALAVNLGIVALALVASIILRTYPTRLGWTAMLAGSQVVALSAAEVLVGTKNHRDWMGLGLIAASLPVGLLVSMLLLGALRLAEKGRPIVMTLAVLQFGVLAGCGMAAVRAWHLPLVVSGVPLAAALVLLGFAVRFVAPAPGRVALVLAIALTVTVAAFVPVGAPMTPNGPRSVELTDSRPNVVLIVLDTLRRDRLGCYGHTGGLTPELDRIAAEGVVYEQAISAAPWTVPSHASMFTGLFPVSHGCSYAHHLWLDDAFLTLAESLRDSGYQTVSLCSNWTMRGKNLLQGFDRCEWLGGPYDGTSVFNLARFLGTPEHWVDKGGCEAKQALADWLNHTYDPDAPFFLFLNLFEPHVAYLPPYKQRKDHLPPDTGVFDATRVAARTNIMASHIERKTDDRTQQILSGLYDGCVQYQDIRLGELIDRLRAATDFDNTLLIITSDHGENLGEAGRWDHVFAINDTLIHVPMIIRYPARFPADSRVAGSCQTTDIPATVFDVLGVDNPLPGASTRTLAPDRFVPATETYAEVAPFYGRLGIVDQTLGYQASDSRFRADHRVIRTDTMKYIWSSDGDHQLYDLTNDPFETQNLAGRMSDVAGTLDAKLAAWWKAQPAYTRETSGDAAIAPIDDKTLERLRSLGYVGD